MSTHTDNHAPAGKERDAHTGRETTGHEWDGIKELNTPLPKWWLYTFYACIAFALVYTVLYPAWPSLHSHTKGVLGWTRRDTVKSELDTRQQALAPVKAKLLATPIGDVEKDPELRTYVQAAGHIAFAENCAACHGAGGAGGKGFPNLADDDWLWGGTPEQILQTVTYGVRNSNPDSRVSDMPRFGADGLLTKEQINDVAEYVLSLSNTGTDKAAAGRGAQVFADNCAACHGEKGDGNPDVGAPRLNDAIWLYGGDKATVVQTITYARRGSMPAWSERLDPATVKLLAAYVHTLGGGK
ncbi:cytochrome-c oxidase, cbb3-type subunit III [Nitrospirillum sp. BR 11164]|uniref:cytochrome-c oxidase, cbb3-type subunit III n=1 Tax=Nitrospirillum sp. BR 11164 TaxID=3104324 RepID=UPI002AFE1D0E|nr:cytochrome-c oxidase, cbb3-type subunit III [Nitrospirillum sp. BR 11164]MEA1651033.1 cytochrome-c oxidase, cbb3-type subunit III [Nitrospirillum sp. BR 11164]